VVQDEAVHVPDGFLDLPTSIGTGVVAAGAVGLALRRSRDEVAEAGAPLAGLTAVFVFAVQMVNFPVGAGTSGHLMGGMLAAALVGPWTAVLCLAVVLVVQALFFADGGLTAAGTNITLIAVVTVLVGFLVARALLAVLPRRPGSVLPAVFVGALVSVPAAAMVFVGLYAVGGAVPIPLGTLTATMLGWHTVIGLGEALITTAVVGAVLATRPDLVHLARHLRPDLVLVDADGAAVPAPAGEVVPVRRPAGRVVAALAAASVLVAAGLSLLASANPDGLEFVGERLGFLAAAEDSATAGSPLADYGVAGVDAAWGTTVAGVVGVLVTAVVAIGLLSLLARRRPDAPADREVVGSRSS
jgi:cobalt/nickel transport system permease protein